MQNSWSILVASGRLENRKALTRILEGLPVEVFCSRTIEQSSEVFGNRSIQIVFSDTTFADGSYRDLLALAGPKTRFILTIEPWEIDLFDIHAAQIFDFLKYPMESTDVELVIIRAARDSVSLTAA